MSSNNDDADLPNQQSAQLPVTSAATSQAHTAAQAKTQRARRRPPLQRPRQRMLAGVAQGVANHLDWPVKTIRLGFIFSSVIMGSGALLYCWLWAFLPTENPVHPQQEQLIQRRMPVALILLGLSVLSGFIIVLTAGNSLPIWWVLLWVTSIASIVWTLRIDRTDPARTEQQRRFVLLASPVFDLFFGLIITLMGDRFLAVESALGYLSVLLGVALLITPTVSDWIVKRFEQQAELAKANQRADIAAHLHDSVLQTLALIQNRAGATSEIARIARAQERELRDWLYSGSAPAAEDLPTELREIANTLELEYGVVFDLVSVGSAQETPLAGDDALSELLAAAKEAMLNAARHAGGNVSVYVELNERQADIFIRDRGPGFNPNTLPDDRFGVKNSVIGRMQRAGGQATVQSTLGEGTQVHLNLPRN